MIDINRVIGIDQSKQCSGVCRINSINDNGIPLFDPFKFSAKVLGTNATIAAWYGCLRDILDTGTRPALVAYELPVIANMGNMILYQLSGVLIHACQRRDIAVLGIHNQTLKKWAGCGRSDKPMAYATELTGILRMTNDEADAIVLAEIALYVANPDLDPGTDVKREIVATLRMTEEQKREATEERLLAAAQKRVAAKQRQEEIARAKEERARKRTLVEQMRAEKATARDARKKGKVNA